MLEQFGQTEQRVKDEREGQARMQENTGLEVAKSRELKARFLELREKESRRAREAGEIDDEAQGALITKQALEEQQKALADEKMALDRHVRVLTD